VLVVETFSDYAAAAEAAAAKDASVGGTYRPDGHPVYFLTPKDPSYKTMQELSFEARNGRPTSSYERALWTIVTERND
jgi:hypothetical protein